MLRRLPISLRFDDDDSEFYEGFIEEKKNNRELSTLILDLLRVYYENDMVRNIVEDYRMANSPFLKIHAEINRIAMEHSKNSISTSMMGDYSRNEVRKAEEPTENSNPQTESPKLIGPSPEEIQTQIDEGIQKALASILTGDGGNILSQIQNKLNIENSQQTINQDNSEIKPIVEKEIPTVVEPPKMETSNVLKEEVKPPMFEEIKSEVVEEKKVEEIKPTVENKPNKPKSFGKLMASIN